MSIYVVNLCQYMYFKIFMPILLEYIKNTYRISLIYLLMQPLNYIINSFSHLFSHFISHINFKFSL